MRFTTMAGRSQFTLDPIKGSRFIATVDRVTTEEAALALVAEVAAAHSDARHHCWAVRLVNSHTRSSDDGEPGGSAGRPILSQIEGHDLHDVAVVVTRWFGGTKLGVGGLIRAYGGCAGKALDAAPKLQVVPEIGLRVEHDYPDTAAVDAVTGPRGLEKTAADYGVAVRFVLQVPFDELEIVRRELIDHTSGRVRFPKAGG